MVHLRTTFNSEGCGRFAFLKNHTEEWIGEAKNENWADSSNLAKKKTTRQEIRGIQVNGNANGEKGIDLDDI